MAEDVLCSVDTCNYWSQGNKCSATSIYVVNQGTNASTSEETDCQTFEHKM